jgi:hypothetical protein
VGDAISTAKDIGVHVAALASKKQEEIPFPAPLARVPRKIRERADAAQAGGRIVATATADASRRKCRL